MTYERDNIAKMQGYASGEQPGDPSTIKLNTNENPWPPSPVVQQALDGILASDLRRYPPPTADGFRQLAASRHGLALDNIIATRGGDELLRLVLTTFVDPGETIAVTDPTYSLYPVLAAIQNCHTARIPLEEDWSLPVDFASRVNATGAKLTLLVNPHAPSGALVDAATLRTIAGNIQGLLLIDEAYIDFVDPALGHDCTDLVRDLDNVIILRTLSKGYSLAGLRFGYGMGAAGLIRPMLEKTRDSYNLDFISQKLAEAALGDIEWARDTWQRVREARQVLAGQLATLGWTVYPSQTNFLLATVPGHPGAEATYQALKAAGVLVRYFNQPRLTDKLRISIGTPDENARLLSALRSIFTP